MLLIPIPAAFFRRLKQQRDLIFNLAMVLLLGSCQSRMPISNPRYTNLFSKLDSLSHEEDLRFIDSVNVLFSKDPPGADDMVSYYRHKANLLTNEDSNTCLAVLDTLDTFLQAHSYLPDFKKYYAEMLSAKVEVYTNMRRYDEGLKILLTAKQFLDENLAGSCLNCQFQQSLGDMLYKQNRFRLAASYYIDVYNSAKVCDSTSFNRFYYSYSGLSNAGISYRESKMYDSAQHCFAEALTLIGRYEVIIPEKKAYFKLCRGVVSSNLGVTKMILKKYEEAEPLMLFAIQATAEEYPNFSMEGRFSLADLYIQSMQLAKAGKVLKELDMIRKETRQTHNFDFSLNNSRKQYYLKKKDYVIAAYYDNIANTLRDSLDDIKRKNIDRDFAMEFSAGEQRKINSDLNIKNERTNFQLQMAISGVVIAALIIVLIWSNLRRAARYSRNLKSLNEEIQIKNRDIVDAYASLEDSYLTNKSLMRTVAHDLKNPLGAIRSLVRWLTKKADDKDVVETLDIINQACGSSIELINDMIKSDSLKLQTTNKQMNDILRLLEYWVELMKSKAKEKNQQLFLQGESAEALVDKDKMWRVISNIINNAIKFSPEKGTIYVRLEKIESAVVLSVQDNGIGIPESLKEKIFESSPEAQREGTAGEESHGLGLCISKKIVEEHNGKLWVESEEGQGSTFFVMLPSGN